MKKPFVIFALIMLVIGLNAQDKVIPQLGGVAGVSNATAAVKAAAYNYVFRVDIDAPYYYTYQAHLDDNTDDNTASFVIAGSLDNVNYKNIDTVAYTGAGSDTTIIGNISANPVTYRYIRYTITPSDTIWVKSLYLKAQGIK